MNNSKRYLFPLLVCVLVLVSSCRTNFNFIADANTPRDQNAKILFNNSTTERYYITEWNENDIRRSLYGRKAGRRTSGPVTLNLPPGMNSIKLDMIHFFYNENDTDKAEERQFMAKDFTIEFYFEPGKEYEVKSTIVMSLFGMLVRPELFLELYNITDDMTLVEEWRITRGIF